MANPVSSGQRARIWGERLLFALAVGAFLTALQAETPNGDGRVYLRQIESGLALWNPNHLLMQPVGLWAFQLVSTLGLGWSMFGTLKVLSGVAAVVSTILFHATLTALDVRPAALRLLGTAGLFFSAHFLSMAVAEEFYMIQMPLVVGALLLGTWWARERFGPARQPLLLAGMGVLAALSTCIAINNAFLALAIGIAVSLPRPDGRPTGVGNALRVWIAGGFIVVPLLLGAYFASASGQSFGAWMTAYQGQASNPTDALYGIVWTPAGVAISLATLVYGAATSLFVMGEVGAVVEALVRSRPIEFTPNPLHIGSASALFLAVAVLAIPLILWIFRQVRRQTLVVFALCWIAGYLAFNFLWVDTSDQFWFQVLPPVWMLVTLFAMDARPLVSEPKARATWRPAMMWVLVPLLAVVNITSVAVPRAFSGVELRRAELLKLLRAGDLVVTPGWDDLLWISPAPGETFDRVLLMDLALKSRRGDPSMSQLPDRVRKHLAGGGRVIVARVFDLDREGRPWEQLEKLRWPRARLQNLLGSFEHPIVGTVDGVTFRELREAVQKSELKR